MPSGFSFLFSLLLSLPFQPAAGTIQTTAGPLKTQSAGIILPHEHIFTDLRGPEAPGYGQADTVEIVRLMRPLLLDAKRQGVTVLVECTSIGVGRNVSVLARLAKETGLSIVVPTGVYGRANFAPRAYRRMDMEELTQWMVKEITEGIDDTNIRAGFIKIASSQTELTPLEEHYLRASAQAARKTGVVIASHTTSGPVAVVQTDILEEEGLSPSQFIWVHAQAEENLGYHKQLAARGVCIEFDSIGHDDSRDESLARLIVALVDSGYVRQILLSQDAGWYDPAKPGGGQPRPYTGLIESFIPRLRSHGLDQETIRIMTVENPGRAFAAR